MEMNNNTNMNEGVFKKNILPQPKFIQYCPKIVITKYLIRSVSVFKCVYTEESIYNSSFFELLKLSTFYFEYWPK